MPELTAHTQEILAWVIGGFAMTFIMMRFSTFMRAVLAKLAKDMRDFFN